MSVSLLAARWVLPVTTPPIDHGAVAVASEDLDDEAQPVRHHATAEGESHREAAGDGIDPGTDFGPADDGDDTLEKHAAAEGAAEGGFAS